MGEQSGGQPSLGGKGPAGWVGLAPGEGPGPWRLRSCRCTHRPGRPQPGVQRPPPVSSGWKALRGRGRVLESRRTGPMANHRGRRTLGGGESQVPAPTDSGARRVTAVVGRETPLCAVGARGEAAGLGTMGFSGAPENVTRERKMRASGKQEPPSERVARQGRARFRGQKRPVRCHLLCGLLALSNASRTRAGGEWRTHVQKQPRFRASLSAARFLA